MEEVTISTLDGFKLPATLFENNAGLPGKGSLVLISSAIGVPREYYRLFAQYMADNGARAVMTYDYRGIDGALSRSQKNAVRMSDWATKDLPAAVQHLVSSYPDHHLSGLGHGFGGQALGLSGSAGDFHRYMLLASGSGYIGHVAPESKQRFTKTRLTLPLSSLVGRVPDFAGFKTPVPYNAFDQWRKWCNSEDYFMSDPQLAEVRRFADVHIPVMAVGFEDDPWATLPAVEALIGWYSHANIRLRWFTSDEAHGVPIGHYGFFLPEHRTTLWPQVSDWLVRETEDDR